MEPHPPAGEGANAGTREPSRNCGAGHAEQGNEVSRKLREPLFRGDGQTLAALFATGRDDRASAFGLHPRAKSVGLLAVAVAGPECALHGVKCLVSTRGWS